MSENAREYKLRLPTFDELTDDQKNAVNAQKPIKLSGLAGTGKSVVSIWRHVENIKNSKNSVLICFNKTLHRYLWLATMEADKVHNTSASSKVHTLYGFAARYIGKDDSIFLELVGYGEYSIDFISVSELYDICQFIVDDMEIA